MYVSRHFILTSLLAIMLFPIYKFKVLLLFVFGFFIDVDHYLHDLFKYKVSLKKSYLMHMNKNITLKDQLHIFHVVEFWILALILTIIFYNDFTLLLFTGLIFHLSLDFIYQAYNKDYIKHTRALSLTAWLIRHKKKLML